MAVKTLQHTRRGLRMVGDQPSLFDMSEPVWHPDEKSPKCDKCQHEFTFLHRRHHCRRCGDVVCNDCCEKQPLARMGFVDPVLVCMGCAPVCKAEDEFYKHHLKLLVNGAYFQLSDTNKVSNCKLSPDHSLIIISSHDNIDMRGIVEVKTNTVPSGEGGHKLASLALTCQANGSEFVLTLSPSPSHSRKQSLDWLRALKKALVMLHNAERKVQSGSFTGSI